MAITIEELERLIHEDVTKRFQEYKGEQPSPEPEPGPTVVRTTPELLAALETGGLIELAKDAEEFFNSSGFIVRSNTEVRAPYGGTVRGGNQPAFMVRPSSNDITLSGMTCLSGFSGGVIQLGNNDSSQVSSSQVPRRINLTDIVIPTHRGKRGIEVNAGTVRIKNCQIDDVYASSGQDSQAIGILNSPGDIEIDGGVYSAGSENIMLGGDSMKVLEQVITGVTIKNAKLYKPLSWQTDGVNRACKNLFEVKAGKDVSLLNCTLDGSWKAAQDGWAIVLTPKNSQFVENILIDGCTVTNVAGGVQLMGSDYNSVTPQPTDGIRIRNTVFEVSKTQYGGRGILMLVVDGAKSVTFENVGFKGDGNCMVQADGKVTQGPCLITGGTLTYLRYGVMMPDSNYGDPISPDSASYPRRLEIAFRNNTFTNSVSSRFKTNFPDNIYP